MTSVNFQPNENEIAIQPSTLKIAIIGRDIFAPSNSCSCRGSVDNRDVKAPEEFSSIS